MNNLYRIEFPTICIVNIIASNVNYTYIFTSSPEAAGCVRFSNGTMPDL